MGQVLRGCLGHRDVDPGLEEARLGVGRSVPFWHLMLSKLLTCAWAGSVLGPQEQGCPFPEL